jgi:hypothetical protein
MTALLTLNFLLGVVLDSEETQDVDEQKGAAADERRHEHGRAQQKIRDTDFFHRHSKNPAF